ncbi:MAG: MarR family transcriptional regulator [Ktedonobacteraceae bacterium]|nr:MarR family transcriptional regulator [Ktedonobacteraceae bacterium]
MDEESISPADYQAMAEFRYQIRRILRFSEEAAYATDLEPQQHQLLLAIKGLPKGRKAAVGEIAERLQIRHHSTVELIDRLVKRGLVERHRDDEDQRRVIVSLTPHGEEILAILSRQMLTELRSTASAFVQSLNALLASTTNVEDVASEK